MLKTLSSGGPFSAEVANFFWVAGRFIIFFALRALLYNKQEQKLRIQEL
jgi:hypothetical protein